MKQIFGFIFIFCSINIYSQIDSSLSKGQLVLGANIGLSFQHNNSHSMAYDISTNGTNYNDQISFSLYFDPSISYFVANRFAIGISPLFSINGFNGTGSDDIVDYSIGIAPFIKYYFKSAFYVGLTTGYLYSLYDTDINTRQTISSLYISPNIGYVIFLNSKVYIDAAINYQYINSMNAKNSLGHNWNLGQRNIYFSIGLNKKI